MYVYLAICLSICLYVCLTICLYVCLTICLSICLYGCLPNNLSVYLCVCLHNNLSVYLSLCLPNNLSVCLSLSQSAFLCVCLSLFLCLSPSVSLTDLSLSLCARWRRVCSCKSGGRVSPTLASPLTPAALSPPQLRPIHSCSTSSAKLL